MTAHRGALYVAGGSDWIGSLELRSVECLQTRGGRWEARAPLNVAQADLDLLVVQDRLFAIGVYRRDSDDKANLRIERYDDGADSWDVLTIPCHPSWDQFHFSRPSSTTMQNCIVILEDQYQLSIEVDEAGELRAARMLQHVDVWVPADACKWSAAVTVPGLPFSPRS